MIYLLERIIGDDKGMKALFERDGREMKIICHLHRPTFNSFCNHTLSIDDDDEEPVLSFSKNSKYTKVSKEEYPEYFL